MHQSIPARRRIAMDASITRWKKRTSLLEKQTVIAKYWFPVDGRQEKQEMCNFAEKVVIALIF
ncbi:hypothetical protein T12_15660 [Trichinella patagoniensis]|uniref:Uncharacterized protein n=1 Tax=Trichinella patagoniensis TaxID=990121 RepID=A0A0V1ABA7_9BILA|nr:hypothetical protein T12_15660 [Trichinella patagoniensis]